MPTRKAVYTLLRRIDWAKANETLSPLWDRLGFTPDLVVRRNLRNPKEILDEFREEQKEAKSKRRKKLAEKREAEERSKGMSAAKAKRSRLSKPKKVDVPKSMDSVESQSSFKPIVIQRDLVIDGKVVKASYNAGTNERFGHVTEIRQNEKG